MAHIGDSPHQAKVARQLNLADNLDLINDADLTSLTAAKAAVDTQAALKHVSDRHHAPNVKRGLEMASDINAATVTGSSIASARALLPAVSGQTGRILH
jgi:hypothetical protein